MMVAGGVGGVGAVLGVQKGAGQHHKVQVLLRVVGRGEVGRGAGEVGELLGEVAVAGQSVGRLQRQQEGVLLLVVVVVAVLCSISGRGEVGG
jgi:hypothetical protein